MTALEVQDTSDGNVVSEKTFSYDNSGNIVQMIEITFIYEYSDVYESVKANNMVSYAPTTKGVKGYKKTETIYDVDTNCYSSLEYHYDSSGFIMAFSDKAEPPEELKGISKPTGSGSSTGTNNNTNKPSGSGSGSGSNKTEKIEKKDKYGRVIGCSFGF